jgi:glycosyltransferase involved in cell wall biosynthesis
MTPARPLRIARVIARLNVGGPARHVLHAARGLAPEFETALFAGDVGDGEAEASAWISASGVVPERVPGLGRAVRPFDDLRALAYLTRRFGELRPDIVHTHTAKAGAIGRIAARRAGVPNVVHTFHGHVFHGYFGRVASWAAVRAERALARRTDRIVAVSDEVANDLVERYRVAPREKVVVVPVGIDLAPYLAIDAARKAAARAALGIEPGTVVGVLAGRLVPVKDPVAALVAWSYVLAPRSLLLVVGDGPLRAELERLGVADVRFLGWRDDMTEVWAAADLALLPSRNEGTPVSLIEAAASGVPALAMRVGGVPSVVVNKKTGMLADPDDQRGFVSLVSALAEDPRTLAEMGAAARERVAARFGVDRMLADLRALYAGLGPAPR